MASKTAATLTNIHVYAFFDALMAPSKSPARTSAIVLPANTMAGIAKGVQQNIVASIALTK